jgi:osmotically-inducible protein OsmY
VGAMTRTLLRTDAQLKSAVAEELQWLSGIDSAHIGVFVQDGAVTLTGTVGTYPETLLAAKAALSVRGVTAIAQEINVRGPFAQGTDSDIARDAGEALQRAVNIPNTVKVSVRDHVLTLSGEVTWQYERDAACRAVNYLSGVRHVNNTMTIRPGELAEGIHADIVAALVRHAQLDGKHITVTTNTRGVITLNGTVATLTERRQAEQVCWSAPGATEVVNNLTIH